MNGHILYAGKTMLMDMFYGATEGIVKHRRRFHFHQVNYLVLCLRVHFPTFLYTYPHAYIWSFMHSLICRCIYKQSLVWNHLVYAHTNAIPIQYRLRFCFDLKYCICVLSLAWVGKGWKEKAQGMERLAGSEVGFLWFYNPEFFKIR